MDASYWTRLYDVFISGPLYLVLASRLPRESLGDWLLMLFVIGVGAGNILYNGHNWLWLNAGWQRKPWPPFQRIVDQQQGKQQWHRLYNLVLMYPLLWYANNYRAAKSELTVWINIMIIVGFLFNLGNWWQLRS